MLNAQAPTAAEDNGPISEDDEAMSVDVLVETTIQRSPAEVSAYAGDPSNAPTWYANIHSVDWRTEPPVGAGWPTSTRWSSGSRGSGS